MRKYLVLIIAIIIFFTFFNKQHLPLDTPHDSSSSTSTYSTDALISAYNNKQSDKIITATGTVSKLLADDNNGSRHQKFIVRISPVLTVLVAHNIDLAPRVKALKKDDPITFKGEYKWNIKGGVIHWTHHDPRGIHPAGWIKYRGKVYQ